MWHTIGKYEIAGNWFQQKPSISTPTRFGNVASQMKQFLDRTGGLWFQGKLVNKVVSAMTSAQNPHGGQEQTILSLYTTMYHWGSIVVAPGYTDQSIFTAGGNPYGTSVTVDQDGKMKEDVRGAVQNWVSNPCTNPSYRGAPFLTKVIS